MPGISVTFRPLSMADAPRMLEWISTPAIRDNLGLQREPSRQHTENWIASNKSDDVWARAIEYEGEHVGNVVLDQIDRKISAARLSIYLGSGRVRGLGIGTAAVEHALQTAFEVLGLEKVWLTVHCGNAAAISVYCKCGFRIEGIHRQEFLLGNRLVDCLYMGVLASEYRPFTPRRCGE